MYSASAASTAAYYVSRKLAARRFFRSRSKASICDAATMTGGKRVLLNVSGAQFYINDNCLKRFPDTLLGSNEKEFFYDTQRKEYFFDRDPCIFRHIFMYYKTGKLHYNDQECFDAYIDELKFFRVPIEGVSICCSDPFAERYASFLSKRKSQNNNRHSTTSDLAITSRQKLWSCLDKPTSSRLAKIYYYLSCLIILFSVTVNTVETVPCQDTRRCGDVHFQLFFIMDSTCVIIFTLEYILRLIAAPNRYLYIKDVGSIIDIAAIAPYYIDLIMATLFANQKEIPLVGALVTLRVLRIFRIFKLARHSKRLRELSDSLRNSASELGFILFTYLIVVILFASILYYAEGQSSNTTFKDIPQSMWYTVVTTTTLGYGDIVPKTIQGKLVGSLCCLMGVLVIALPVPIIQMKSSTANMEEF